MKKVVLYSGGMDSTTLLAQSVSANGAENVLALSIGYASLHESSEGKAAKLICELLGVERRIINLPADIFRGGTSALLGEVEMPKEEYHDIEKESPSATIVPFRNAVLIAIATAVAEANGYERVLMAAHMNDAIGYAYPDCTPEFLTPMSAAVNKGTLGKVSLEAPYTRNTKADIVMLAAVVRAPLALSWSCYRGGEVHCGECPTCLERQKAFYEAGYVDPTTYKKDSPLYLGEELIIYPTEEDKWE